MKTALITGVSGYLGSHLSKELKKSGFKVVGLDIKHTRSRYVDIYHLADVCKEDQLNEIFSRVKIDIVFHLAGRIEVGESVENPTEFYHVNVGGTCQLLNVMKKHGVNNIVYSSTAAVYKTKDTPLVETDETTVFNSPYGGTKLCAEYAIRQSGLNYIIFRYFNLAGADEELEFGENHVPETHLIPKIYQNLNNFKIYGNDYPTLDGTCIRDYVHVSDVAEAHLLAADYLLENKKSTILNLGTNTGYSVKEIVHLIEDIIGKEVECEVYPKRPGDPPKLTADISLASKVLNYRPKRDIIKILKTAYDWQNKNG